MGPAVYDRLMQQPVPADIEVIDGGLAGIDLLRFIEGTSRVVFVDSVCGFVPTQELVVMTAQEIAAIADQRYDHSSGLTYLLRALPGVCEGETPDITIVGVEGRPRPEVIEKAALLALDIAAGDDTVGDYKFLGGTQWKTK